MEIEGSPISLSIYVHIDRDSERAVFIYGSWNGGYITKKELYRPLPGRQGADCYYKANHRCHIALLRFEKWLEIFEHRRRRR